MSFFERMCDAIFDSPSPRRRPESGAAMVEYAILVAGMALVVAAAVLFFGNAISNLLSAITI